MNFQLVAVSKLCSEVMSVKSVCLKKDKPLQPYQELEDSIFDIFGNCLEDIDIYWRYSKDEFFRINDYVSYMAALTLSAEKEIYLLLRDYDEPWQDNIDYLNALDYVEERKEKERNRDIYDVKIKRPGDVDSEDEDERIIEESQMKKVKQPRSNAEVILFALRNNPEPKVLTADLIPYRTLVKDISTATASLLCFANILGMKGDLISCPHKDIYFLETNTKSESTDLANLFASPAGREMVKYKPRTKLKHKLNPALEFFIQNKSTKTAPSEDKIIQEESKCGTSTTTLPERPASRRSSIDLYEEAATILGLTCSQTDDCKCIECQCHYFDFEEEMDSFQAGSDCVVDHASACSIQ